MKDLKTKLTTEQSEVFPCASKGGLQGRFARAVRKERGRVQAKKRDETHGRKEEQQGKELEHQRKEIERIKAQISASASASAATLATYAGTCVASPRMLPLRARRESARVAARSRITRRRARESSVSASSRKNSR